MKDLHNTIQPIQMYGPNKITANGDYQSAALDLVDFQAQSLEAVITSDNFTGGEYAVNFIESDDVSEVLAGTGDQLSQDQIIGDLSNNVINDTKQTLSFGLLPTKQYVGAKISATEITAGGEECDIAVVFIGGNLLNGPSDSFYVTGS